MAVAPLKLHNPTALTRACELVVERLCNKRDEWHEADRDKKPKHKAPEKQAYPTAGLPKWCRWVAALIRKEVQGCEGWHRNADLVEHFADLAGDILERLRRLPEFETIDLLGVCEIRWSTSAMVQKDGPHEAVIAGRAKAIPLADRLTWAGEGAAPMFRLDLNLPAFLLAEDDELEAPMHSLLCQLAVQAGRPYIRKADIVGFSANLGRYGVRGPREVQAIAHAMAHPDLERKLVQHRYDLKSGQGLLWDALVVRAGLDN